MIAAAVEPAEPSAPAPRRARWVRLALAALLVWSFLVRLWFASIDLDSSRWWDERYSLENVGALLESGSLRPANGFHPALSYLPQALLVGASRAAAGVLCWFTGSEAFALRAGNGFSPPVYLLSRLLQVAYGTFSLWLLFRLGCHLMAPGFALLATFLLAMTPWHLRQSAIYKPDILLLLLALAATLAAVRVAVAPSRRGYLVGGLLVGLALATKFNAAPAAAPLALAGLVQGSTDRRQWRWLAAAGAVAVTVFLALDPYLLLAPEIYRRDFSRTLRDYARKGAAAQSGPAEVFLHGLESLASPPFHGLTVAALAAIGALALGAAALRSTVAGARPRQAAAETPPEPRQWRWAIALSYPATYAVAYSLSTSNLSPHNWLPLSPFVTLLAAAAIAAAWRLAGARLPARVRPVAAGAGLLLLLPPAVTSLRYLYTHGVPTTRDHAERRLRASLGPLAERVILYEGRAGRLVVGAGSERPALLRVDDLAQWPATRRALADAEVWGLTAPPSAVLDTHAELERFGSSFWRARGDDLAIRLHPWERAAPAEVLQPERRAREISITLPPPPAPEVVNLEVTALSGVYPRNAIAAIVADHRPLRFAWTNRARRRQRWVTERFERGVGAPVEIVLRLDPKLPLERIGGGAGITLRLERWRSAVPALPASPAPSAPAAPVSGGTSAARP